MIHSVCNCSTCLSTCYFVWVFSVYYRFIAWKKKESRYMVYYSASSKHHIKEEAKVVSVHSSYTTEDRSLALYSRKKVNFWI